MKRYLPIFAMLCVVIFLMLACGGGMVLSSPKPKVIEVANSYVAERYPDFDLEKSPAQIRDEGDVWVIEYMLPDDSLGGTPVVMISKKDLKVVSSYRTQ